MDHTVKAKVALLPLPQPINAGLLVLLTDMSTVYAKSIIVYKEKVPMCL